MSKINIGQSGKHAITLDLSILLRTRLLIQANSGGGKSWLLRRIAEQAFGHVQVIIIDPEGEFATLREKYGYVLVGKGGETPSDVRSAALVAHKLLELNASAVCDLYEMKARDRHEWVRLFLDALLDAPKSLWHPVLIIVDEAHTYAPEKGAGESVASDAMIGLATRGRKRGFCAIFATQRLGKLRKDAAAELTNVLIGQTFIDIDRKRAAEALGIPRSDERKFFDDMRVMEPGNFWALGRAVTLERTLISVGRIETTHPESGSGRQAAEPPPPPEKIRSLLPKLADLPQAAEKKAKTEADLRADITALRRQLAERPAAVIQEPRIERVEVTVFKDGEVKMLASAIRSMESIAAKHVEFGNQLSAAARDVATALRAAANRPAPQPIRAVPVAPRPTYAPARQPAATIQPAEGLTAPQQRILDALAWLESVRLYQPKRTIVAFLAQQSPKSSGFQNNLSALRSRGLTEYSGGDALAFTDAGRAAARHPDSPATTEELHRAILDRLPKPQARILQNLIANYPQPMDRVALAEQSGQSPKSSGYQNNLSALRSLGVADYHGAAAVKALPVLFLD